MCTKLTVPSNLRKIKTAKFGLKLQITTKKTENLYVRFSALSSMSKISSSIN